MKKICLFIFLSCACSCEFVDYDFEIYGVPIYLSETGKGPDEKYLQDATDYFINELSIYSKHYQENLKETFYYINYIAFYDDFLYSGDIECYGLYRYNTRTLKAIVQIYNNNTCMGKISYFHELVHHFLLREITPGDSDGDHNGPYWEWVREVRYRYLNAGDSINCQSTEPE